jgi:aminopeptidase N
MMQSVPRVMTRVGAAAARRAGGGRTAGRPIAHAAGAPGAARLAARVRAAAAAPPWSSRPGGARTLTRASSASAAPAVDAPKPILLSEYAAPEYTYASVTLEFDLGEEITVVTNTCAVEPAHGGSTPTPLFLHGDDSLDLISVHIDGTKLERDQYSITSKGMTIATPPSGPFELKIVTNIKPQENTELEGLYKSSGNFCTQCEAEGFRRITFFQDRPDVMSVFTTKIVADKQKYPVLLSNGNLIESGVCSDDATKHFTVWNDPFVKPSYLFALVAGDLSKLEKKFVTKSGREVALKIYVEAHNLDKTDFAMESLIHSMRWDEEVFGLEYDLDLFNIVAVDDFNMGAMENKSLNIFNSRLVLATPTTATDADYAAIEGVVAHEYFHNWTGNRVTCRDWFQLSLKEGLTVYRDQEFSSDMNSRGVKRIGDVSRLRASQFPQDAGPMAHPIRPESYIKMDNFYTVTVYEKGAEVVRMYETLLGKAGFRKGMDLYFERHDGQAVTCDDFLNAMADANEVDLTKFKPWYSQAGTPTVTASAEYDAEAATFALTLTQRIPDTPGQTDKKPVLMPIKLGLVGSDGKDMPLKLRSATGDSSAATSARSETSEDGTISATLRFSESSATYVFEDVREKPTLSILRDFSAPVKVVTELTRKDLIFLMANDSDLFNKWEAGQTLFREVMLGLIRELSESGGDETSLRLDQEIVQAVRAVLLGASDANADKAFIARALTLPSESELSELVTPADPDAIRRVRDFVVVTLAKALKSELEAGLHANSAREFSRDGAARSARSLKNTCLSFLSRLGEKEIDLECLARFERANNMTDQIAALACLTNRDGRVCPERQVALDSFYERWRHDSLIMNKWLGVQAGAAVPNNVENVLQLMHHPAFDIKNPNKVYSLVGGFVNGCPSNFHDVSGSGYAFLGDAVLRLDEINGSVAARLVAGFARWKKYDEKRQALMKAQLERIMRKKGLSENVYEIVAKSLE